MHRIARVPASSANLGPGFDALAVALALYVEVETRKTLVPLESLRRFLMRPGASIWPEVSRYPAVYISPYGPEHTSGSSDVSNAITPGSE